MAARRSARRTLIGMGLMAAVVACSPDASPGAAGEVDRDRGRELFTNNCAVCHGPVGQGTTVGPPLVHQIYEPGHHSDESFQLAVARGVTAHHWNYGHMPPIAGLDRDDVADIVAYVRHLQRQAGIID